MCPAHADLNVEPHAGPGHNNNHKAATSHDHTLICMVNQKVNQSEGLGNVYIPGYKLFSYAMSRKLKI